MHPRTLPTLCALALASPVPADQPCPSWAQVQSLARGTEVVVRLASLPDAIYTFIGADDDRLSLAHNGREVTIARSEIERISVEVSSGGRWALIGGAIGLGIGIAGGAGPYTVAGAAAFAMWGAIAGRDHPRHRAIYAASTCR